MALFFFLIKKSRLSTASSFHKILTGFVKPVRIASLYRFFFLRYGLHIILRIAIDQLIDRVDARFHGLSTYGERKAVFFLRDLVFLQIDQAVFAITSLCKYPNVDLDRKSLLHGSYR